MFKNLTDKQCYNIAYYGFSLLMSLVIMFLFFYVELSDVWFTLVYIILFVFIFTIQDAMKRFKPKA